MNNFCIINEEDKPFLLDAKDEVEQQWEENKWKMIAEKVKLLGGDEYEVRTFVDL
jgi:hypothetical protein